MHNQGILIGIIALLIGGIGGYALGNHSDHEWKRFNRDDSYKTTDVPAGMHQMHDGTMMTNANTTGMGHMMDMMVSSEREFIDGMIPHHQEAVRTAKEVLARGATTPEMKTLAEGIIAAQEREIADMQTWYESWYGTPYTDNGTYTPMMRPLANLSGKELDKTFLEDMIMHHMGAIMMAHSVEGHIEHTEMQTLTTTIVDTQSSEIQDMRRMLTGL